MGIGEKKVYEVDQGEEKNLVVYMIDKDLDEPVDLTGATEITARFRKADGTLLLKTLTGLAITVLSIAGAKLQVKLLEADTALLMVGSLQQFELEAVVGGVTTIVKFPRALTVNPATA